MTDDRLAERLRAYVGKWMSDADSLLLAAADALDEAAAEIERLRRWIEFGERVEARLDAVRAEIARWDPSAVPASIRRAALGDEG